MIEKENYLTPKTGLRVLYEGDFEFEKLRDAIKSWYRSKKFTLTEKEYLVKDTSLGKEIEITWTGERKQDDFAKLHLDIKMIIKEMKKAGKIDNGKVDARVIAWIELDYKNKFAGKSGKFMLNVYSNYLKKEKMQGYQGKLISEVSEIYNNLKEMLDLYS